ncbi:19029_t:CDS:2, partial [Racocetra fulgida]
YDEKQTIQLIQELCENQSQTRLPYSRNVINKRKSVSSDEKPKSLSCGPEYPCRNCCEGACKKTEVTKKIFTNNQGIRYVKSIAPYWSSNIYLRHIDAIDDLIKKRCRKCQEKAVCSKVMLLNGTCDVDM